MDEKPSFQTRLSLSLELSLVLFVGSGMVAIFEVWRAGGHGAAPYLVAVAIPAFAWVLLVLLACSFPPLLGSGRLAFPLNLTIPPVYTGLVYLVQDLLLRSGSSLTAPPDRLLPAVIWSRPMVLVVCLVAQVASLTLLLLVMNSRDRMARQ